MIETTEVQIIGEYLCVNVGRCTCDGPFDAVPDVDHRDGCGYEPVATLGEIEQALVLAGRTVVQLPEPDEKATDEPHGLRPQARWRSDQLEVSGIASSWGPRVNVSGGPFLTDEQAERWAVTLLAAAREARRLASGSSKGGDPKP